MFIMHIALQGCLKAGRIDYGLTADTGGHIRYLLDLAAHVSARAEVRRQAVVTRAFDEPRLGPRYARAEERLDAKTALLRIPGEEPGYLPKEELHREHDALSRRLIERIEKDGERPDLLHGHYADGGEVARRVAERLGIPFVFTAHSLGRVKAAACCDGGEVPSTGPLATRVAIEEGVIAAASAIVASSCDEAERQYALYDAYDPARIRVNPPGGYMSPADVVRARAQLPAVERSVGRFLGDPDKPCLLALARPVRKKNLTGLLKAYGESEALQEAANLVVFAGSREDIRSQEPENRAVLEELLYLVDRYDLHGRVALPKTHAAADVPAIYAYAAERGGVFVNAALNEPFGLTILEAAAAGLPVVATCKGGPADIVSRCGNGVLVDPHSPRAIAKGALDLLMDDRAWRRSAAAGLNACGYYDWARHAEDYLALCGEMLAPGRPAPRPHRPYLIATDVDATLTGDEAALRRFAEWQAADADHVFGIATGRSLHSAIEVLKDWNAPIPEILITSVGAEIYYSSGRSYAVTPDEEWAARIAKDWRRDAVAALADAMPGLERQGDAVQRPFKLSYFCKDDPRLVENLRRRLADAGLKARVIFSHGRMLDILPARASKGHALRHVRRRFGIPESGTIAAGDSGNDVALLKEAGHAILVANHDAALDPLIEDERTFLSGGCHAAGLLEGIIAFHRPGDPMTDRRPRPAHPAQKDPPDARIRERLHHP